MMGIGDTPRWRIKPGSLVPPTFPPGEITYQIVEGDTTNRDTLADLEVLHNLCRTDGHRLKLAHEIREKAIAERQAWLEAHPPQPQDIIVGHWEVVPPAPSATKETEARP